MGKGNAVFTTQHEQIDVRPGPKLVVVRQDRLVVDSARTYIRTLEGVQYTVLDFSPFGLALFSQTELPEQITNAAFVVENVELGQTELKRVRSEKFVHYDQAGIKTAFMVIGMPLSLEKAQAVHITNETLQKHIELHQRSSIPDMFRLMTYELKGWLASLEENVNRIEKTTFEHSHVHLSTYEAVVTQMVSSYIEDNVYPLYENIQKFIQGMDSQQVKACFEFFRAAVGPYMYQSAYANRAYTKPRGYAGDFEMMNSIYFSESRGHTLFARCMEHYFVNVPESQAVRNRAEYLKTKIVDFLKSNKGPQKIVSVACGSSRELQLLIQEHGELLREDVEFHLVDQDEEALKVSQRNLHMMVRLNNVKARFHFHHRSMKHVIEAGLGMQDVGMIYSAGLFDYLSDAVATFAAQRLFASLRKNGQVIIGNFDISAPNKFGMSLVTDWHLIFRSDADLARLFGQLGTYELERESLGINLFAVMKK